MDFTPKNIRRPVLNGILIIAAMGLIGRGWQTDPVPAPIARVQDNFAGPQQFRQTEGVAIVPAVLITSSARSETAQHYAYQPASWYKDKHWWKRNAPIIGGAGGGALIGGLAGGGKGALIGGAVGGGGGYLYKHYHHRHHAHHYH